MAIKVQYVASDNTTFDNEVEAKAYEAQLERIHKLKEYYVVLTLKCDCWVDARDENEAIDIAKDKWCADDLSDRETIDDVRVYESNNE